MVVIATGAFVAGAFVATQPGRDERHMVVQYVRDWQRGDVAGMYTLLDRRSHRDDSEREFAGQLRDAAATATVTSLRPLRFLGASGRSFEVEMLVTTKLWGRLQETLRLPISGSGSGARVHLAAPALFPGLRSGERLHREIRMAPRGTLLAADGETLAAGPNRTSSIPTLAGEIVGTVGPIPSADAAHYAALGYPANAQVGLDGLELVFQRRLAGRLGGRLLAGSRVLASAAPVQGQPVRTTIVPALEQAAVAALNGQYAGMVVMSPRTGALEALAGIAFSAPQPPGSTMKIVTSTGVLEAGLAKLSTVFPVQTSTTLDGYTMQNANGEACGGTLLNAFAVSCNSVFAPLGAKLGASRLVAAARRYGFDAPSPIAGAAESTIPSAHTIGNALSVGSSAIGQGMVLATPLQMTDVAATIADRGRRPIPTLAAGARPRFVRVTTPTVAGEIQQMMVAVVQFGTGVSAEIPGVEVAGKTGTAELVDTATTQHNGNANNPKDTDAWFVGYAPVGHPQVVVGALFPNQGAGAQAAAPAVRAAIEAALAH